MGVFELRILSTSNSDAEMLTYLCVQLTPPYILVFILQLPHSSVVFASVLIL